MSCFGANVLLWRYTLAVTRPTACAIPPTARTLTNSSTAAVVLK